jgi:hypothetical protein
MGFLQLEHLFQEGVSVGEVTEFSVSEFEGFVARGLEI